ncbi:MAG: hypothetical protein ACJ72G_04175 [Friedmanniella sp.]|jgi:predicted metal-binding membrane protein
MWLFISARLRQWAIFAIVVPVATTLVHVVRTRLEARSGQTRVTKALAMVEGFGQRRRRDRKA